MLSKRIQLLFLAASFSIAAFANMASPIIEGTSIGSPFISRYVDIASEKITVVLNGQFEEALFKVEYHLKAHKSGKQIPLLFWASEFKEGFKVSVDGKEIELSYIPEAYRRLEGTPIADFGYLFRDHSPGEVLQLPVTDYYQVTTNDLKFFDVDLAEGDHVITVEYVASAWTDRSNWINQYSFRYALSPAKYWKSYGSLEITLDASQFEGDLTTSLGAPASGDIHSVAIWKFSALPKDELQIAFTPPSNKAASILLAVSPFGFAMIFAVVGIGLHYLVMKRYRKARPGIRFSWVMILGSVAIPFLTCVVFVSGFDLIDAAIGEDASEYHGYTFLVFGLYPFVMPAYWVIMWLVDRMLSKRMKSRQTTNS